MAKRKAQTTNNATKTQATVNKPQAENTIKEKATKATKANANKYTKKENEKETDKYQEQAFESRREVNRFLQKLDLSNFQDQRAIKTLESTIKNLAKTDKNGSVKSLTIDNNITQELLIQVEKANAVLGSISYHKSNSEQRLGSYNFEINLEVISKLDEIKIDAMKKILEVKTLLDEINKEFNEKGFGNPWDLPKGFSNPAVKIYKELSGKTDDSKEDAKEDTKKEDEVKSA